VEGNRARAQGLERLKAVRAPCGVTSARKNGSMTAMRSIS
jgi:hypothetical protein